MRLHSHHRVGWLVLAAQVFSGVEGAAEVGEYLAGLGGQVTSADEVAVSVLGFLPAMNTIVVPFATTTWV